MATASGKTKESLMGRLFKKLSAWFTSLARKIRELFSPHPKDPRVPAGTVAVQSEAQVSLAPYTSPTSQASDNAPTPGSQNAPPVSVEPQSPAKSGDLDSQVLLGSLQTMVATPTVPAAVGSESAEHENHNETEDTGEQQGYVPKIRPKPSPPLPKEHRDLLKKLVRAGKRKQAAQQLEELGYLFPEVSTRGKYIVVKYRGRDGYLYAARIKYKA
jgi:hypothetical protein